MSTVARSNVLAVCESVANSALPLLTDLVNINSYSENVGGVNHVQDFIEALLGKYPLSVIRHSGAQHPHPAGDTLVAKSSVSPNRLPTMLLGHVDTVHAPDTGFLTLKLDGDRAYGPGTCDMKAGVALILLAVEVLHQLKLLQDTPLTLIFNPDEEIGTDSSVETIQREALLCSACLVFEPGRAHDNIVTTRKGVGTIVASATGKASHAGNAVRDGANAIVQLSHTLIALQALTAEDLSLSVSVGTVRGGSATNVVPDSATAEVDFRVLGAAQYALLEAHLLRIAKDVSVAGTAVEIAIVNYRPPMEETASTDALLHSYQAAGVVAGLTYDRVPFVTGGGSDANFTAALGIPTLDGLGPYGEGMHTHDEFVLMSSFFPKLANLVLYLLHANDKVKL